MSLRLKITFALLAAGVLTALAVSWIARGVVERQFTRSLIEQAFANYQVDVVGYFNAYGSLENALRSERFPEFVARTRMSGERRTPGGPPLAPEPPAGRMAPEGPPRPRPGSRVIRFRVVNERGEVLLPQQQQGLTVPGFDRAQAKELRSGDTLIGFALPDGVVELSAQDQQYLRGIDQAFGQALLVTLPLILGFGLLWGSLLSRPLRLLSGALERAGRGDLGQRVKVGGRDEIGLLGRDFNHMSEQLAAAQRAAEAAQARVQELSVRDELTGLHNRRYFNQQAEFVLEQARRHPQPVSLMIADVDHFKRINDTFGHGVGDQVLREVARIAKETARSSDVVARYGGEEFVLLFPNTRLEDAALVCERLRERIADHPWFVIHPDLGVTVSAGLSGDGGRLEFEPMLCEADAQLYAAKNGGRNRVCFAVSAP